MLAKQLNNYTITTWREYNIPYEIQLNRIEQVKHVLFNLHKYSQKRLLDDAERFYECLVEDAQKVEDFYVKQTIALRQKLNDLQKQIRQIKRLEKLQAKPFSAGGAQVSKLPQYKKTLERSLVLFYKHIQMVKNFAELNNSALVHLLEQWNELISDYEQFHQPFTRKGSIKRFFGFRKGNSASEENRPILPTSINSDMKSFSVNSQTVQNLATLRTIRQKMTTLCSLPANLVNLPIYSSDTIPPLSQYNFRFNSQEELDSLLNEIEHIYSKSQTQNNLFLARSKLSSLSATRFENFESDSLIFGVLLGICIPLIILLVIFFIQGNPINGTQSGDWVIILPIYRLLCVPLIAVWGWGVALYVWHRNRINHVYIFNFNLSNSLTHRHVFKVASFLTMIALFSFLLYIGVSGGHFTFWGVTPHLFPGITFILFVVFLFFPFRIFHRSSRFRLISAVLNVMIAPFGKIGFFEWYIGDVITSLVRSVLDLEYSVCYYATGDFLHEGADDHGGWLPVCHSWNKYLPQFFAFMPLFWRMMQCLRRFVLTQNFQHLANAGKYGSGFSVILFAALHGNYYLGNAEWNATRILWGISFVFATLYMYTWDVTMDWGLGRNRIFGRTTKYRFLRKNLYLLSPRGSAWFYYYAIFSNFFLRFFWTVSIGGSPIPTGIPPAVLSWIAAVVEVVRRMTWSIIRVENEYQSNEDNVEVFERETKFIPLPFGFEEGEQLKALLEDEEEESETMGGTMEESSPSSNGGSSKQSRNEK
eukprot:TRINITY_DN18901_c0_g1_i1.p1 TRINITY_DN18901_c0_g1~~TRINITY_DN18901_c0_g1_i1.p1  ORF type:complete len:759 (-),score=134.31 TRINITY_DN18901_c0_g1_i1:49-2325(-)